MQHLLLKAAATATDEGTFEAVISTATPDREGDIVRPAAMAAAFGKWAALGKLMPLAWVHANGTGTEDVIGHVEPATVRVQNDEVIVKGWVNQELERGKEAWRLIKGGTVSFSFGYLIPEGGATRRTGGRLDIKAIDVYEVSVVPIAPANNETRVLSFKSLEERDQVLTELHEVKARLAEAEAQIEGLKEKNADVTDKEPKARSVDPLSKRARELAVDVRSGGLTAPPPQKKDAPEPKPTPEFDPAALRKRTRDLMVQTLSGIEVP